ncbi:MAG: NAD-dependent deacylase [Chloroflexi bacterium]|nr:NAD-dependent deacylase [Chloroflexota bacterium]
MSWPELVEDAAQIIHQAQHLTLSTGAGMSKESGVPTFRDAHEGLWEKYKPEELATPQAFQRNPDLVWSWYMFRLDLVSGAEPNAGHRAVAALDAFVPKVTVITQNIDSFHQLSGSVDVVELHGNIRRFRCFDNCQGPRTIIDLATSEVSKEIAPPCPHCDARVRPDVVWYGETLPEWAIKRAFEEAAACDVMLVIGTSGLVNPAARLPQVAKEAGATIIEVNPSFSMVTPIADLVLEGPAGEVMPAIVAALGKRAAG